MSHGGGGLVRQLYPQIFSYLVPFFFFFALLNQTTLVCQLIQRYLREAVSKTCQHGRPTKKNKNKTRKRPLARRAQS